MPLGPTNGYCNCLPEVERPGIAVDRSYPSSAEVKNEWKHTSTPRMHIFGMDRDNLAVRSLIQLWAQ
jgi:hypothetical protein